MMAMIPILWYSGINGSRMLTVIVSPRTGKYWAHKYLHMHITLYCVPNGLQSRESSLWYNTVLSYRYAIIKPPPQAQEIFASQPHLLEEEVLMVPVGVIQSLRLRVCIQPSALFWGPAFQQVVI